MTDYVGILRRSWSTLLGRLEEGTISIWSEGDLQCYLLREVCDFLSKEGVERPFPVHSEVTVAGFQPDLVLGRNETIVELKFERQGTGGYTVHRKEFDRVVEKMRAYSSDPKRRCVFMVLDETGYFARPDRKQYFDPILEGFDSPWSKGKECFALCAEYVASEKS